LGFNRLGDFIHGKIAADRIQEREKIMVDQLNVSRETLHHVSRETKREFVWALASGSWCMAVIVGGIVFCFT